ncbi:hypothetical protein B0T10DRAFT_562903 [Thelonectria olida]|uniref:Uncharacterized protein n=1 Tax=Thelonectria olida TaxID=1576542 RepID=A0A9P9AKT0_9HYPO|nr:hypothetical protein B0T10DRAFT_562903 [Thelonectria olida]
MGPDFVGVFICDNANLEADSAILIKMRGCIDDCAQDFAINYVSITTTANPGEAAYTSTIKGKKRSEAFLHRRDAPSNVLMTLYTQAVDGTDPSSNAVSMPTSASTQGTAFSPSYIDVRTVEDAIAAPSNSLSLSIAPGPSQSDETVQGGDSMYSLTRTITDAELATTVSAVLYTIVDMENPAHLIVTKVYVTLTYTPCPICPNHGIPSVEMTTMVARCSACGQNGENDIALTVPEAACSICEMVGAGATTVGLRPHESNVQQQPQPNGSTDDTEVLPTGPAGEIGGHWGPEMLPVSAIVQPPASAEGHLPSNAAQQFPDSATQQPSASDANQVPVSASQRLPDSGASQFTSSILSQVPGFNSQRPSAPALGQTFSGDALQASTSLLITSQLQPLIKYQIRAVIGYQALMRNSPRLPSSINSRLQALNSFRLPHFSSPQLLPPTSLKVPKPNKPLQGAAQKAKRTARRISHYTLPYQ